MHSIRAEGAWPRTCATSWTMDESWSTPACCCDSDTSACNACIRTAGGVSGESRTTYQAQQGGGLKKRKRKKKCKVREKQHNRHECTGKQLKNFYILPHRQTSKKKRSLESASSTFPLGLTFSLFIIFLFIVCGRMHTSMMLLATDGSQSITSAPSDTITSSACCVGTRSGDVSSRKTPSTCSNSLHGQAHDTRCN